MTRRPLRALPAVFALVLLAACGDTGEGSATTAASTGTDPGRVCDLQGHRGARGLRPESTLPSFEAALDLEVDTLEMDLHLSSDGVVVVWHDPVIDPAKCGLDPAATATTPDPDDGATAQRDLMVSTLTAAQIAGYRCDRNPDPERFPDQRAAAGVLAGDDYTIQTLEEIFSFVAEYAASTDKSETQRANAGTVRFNIETKRVPDDPAAIGDGFDGETAAAFELAVLAAVDRAGVEDRTTIQSFDHRSLWAIHDRAPDIALAALTRQGDIPDFAELVLEGAAIWSPDRRSVSATTLGEAHTAGLVVVPWTVNDPAEMESLLELGVDGIITDRPDLAPGR